MRGEGVALAVFKNKYPVFGQEIVAEHQVWDFLYVREHVWRVGKDNVIGFLATGDKFEHVSMERLPGTVA